MFSGKLGMDRAVVRSCSQNQPDTTHFTTTSLLLLKKSIVPGTFVVEDKN